MTQPPKNHGKKWSPSDIAILKKEVKENTPTRLIGLHLGRTEDSVYKKANELNISLAPTYLFRPLNRLQNNKLKIAKTNILSEKPSK